MLHRLRGRHVFSNKHRRCPVTRRKYFVNLFPGLLALLLWTPCMGQKKYEREYRIKSDQVPEKAMSFLVSAFENAKIHWYREEGLTEKSVEAKFKASGQRYSIEFDQSGNIQDIEILFTVSQMSQPGQATLKDNLGNTFSKYKIVKTQIHWEGSEISLKESLAQKKPVKGVLVMYELIVRGIRVKKEQYYEVTAESNGEIVSIKEIIQKNVDNLLY